MTNSQTKIIDNAIAVERANRKVESAGHMATLTMLRDQESDDIVAWFERCRPVYAPSPVASSTEDLAADCLAGILAQPRTRYLGEDSDNDLSVYLVLDEES